MPSKIVLRTTQDLNLLLGGASILAKATITIRDNGPLLISGDVELVDAEGKVFETREQFALCRCGLSEKKPFCDGAHRKGFESTVRAE